MNRARFLKFLDATAGAVACRALGLSASGDHHAGARLPPADKVARLLVIRPGGMGDMIVLLPALARLQQAFPNARLDIVCEQRNLGVLRLAGLGESAMPYDTRPLRLLLQLRRRRYDAAVDTEQFHHFSAVLARLSRAPVRIGFKINPPRNPLYTHLISYAPDGPEGEQFQRLLAPLEVRGPLPPLSGSLAHLRPRLPPAVAAHMDALQASDAFAVMHAGASTPYKAWPADRFVEVALALYRDHGLPTALVGGAEDRERTAAIRARLLAAGVPAAAFAGEADLEGTASLMRQARIYVGSDSGLAHLAVALGLGTVVLFGPSDPAKWGTADATHAVVRRELPCAPCFIFGYHKPCRSRECMQRIEVAPVLEACRRVLAATAASPRPA